jgi:thiamine biosynthesis protein ThiS
MPAEPIEVMVNGERKSVPGDLTVTALLKILDVPLDRVAVELNKSIIRKRNWEETYVAGGSQIEIVQFVGGG